MTSDNIVCIPSAVKMPIMTLPTKTVLIKLEHGVILFSPSSGLEEHRERIDSFGEVTDIVAPNLYHNLGVSGAKALLPKSKSLAVSGMVDKIPDQKWGKVLVRRLGPILLSLSSSH